MPRDPRHPTVELALLAGLVVAPFTRPALLAALLVMLVALLWGRDGVRPRRESVVGWLGFGGAAVLLLLAAAGERGRAPDGAALERGSRVFWSELAADAERASTQLPTPPFEGTELRAAFRALEDAVRAHDHAGRTLVLLDPSGEPVVWAGAGLLHRLGADRLPETGFALRQSATSVSTLAVRPVPRAPGWRLVAGESRALDALPPVAGSGAEGLRGAEWRLEASTSPDEPPTLRVRTHARPLVPQPSGLLARAAAALAGLTACVLAVLRGVGLALLAGTVMPRRHPAWAVGVSAALGLIALAAASGASAPVLSGLGLALAVALAGWFLGSGGRGPRVGVLVAAVAPVVIAAIAAGTRLGAFDLGLGLAGGVDAVTLRFALVVGTAGLLACGAALRAPRRSEAALWISLAAAATAAVLADRPLPALGSAALAGGAGWMAGERWRLRTDLVEAVERLLPPGRAEVVQVAEDAERELARLGAEVLLSGSTWNEAGDLGYALWRRSPLARPDLLSALVVWREDGPPSSFSYGLPLDERFELDTAAVRWVDLVPEPWRVLRQEGGLLLPAGAEVRFWVVPRPGFGGTVPVVSELAAGLLRGGPGASRGEAVGLPEGAAWVAWDAAGRLLASPWREGTPPRAAFERAPGETGTIDSPAGANQYAFSERDGIAVALLVPRLTLATAFERLGLTSAAGLGVAAALVLLGAGVALPRAAARDLARRAVRSYSTRLVLVFGLLLLVPLVLLYALLSQTLGRRVAAEQGASAEAALVSVQRVLGEYVLSLEPGFGLGTAIDDELMVWLSRVVRHEVNLYWGSEVYASSKLDLFSAGLLPRRIPGEIWERIALGGEALARRTGRAGGAEYLELFAPLELPGTPSGSSRLFLAMPLLAQQEEVLAETGRIRRRALLASLALFLILAASGSRLAASFTRPIQQFVAGTRRIAAGDAELGFRPAELELVALAEAIDRMAAHIADGRARLVTEKQLVERIVETVTAGVVGLDSEGRVLLANRVARDLLGARPGEELGAQLARDPGLDPVARFLAGRVAQPARAAVRLAVAGEEQEWTLVWAPLPGPADPAALLVLEDVTEVVRGQRLEAWASMARIIAHEIKNPLTPIRLSAEHLKEAWARDRVHFATVFERCTENILGQVEELRQIASEFSIYSHIPRIDLQLGDLGAAVRELVDVYRAAPPPGVGIRFVASGGELLTRFDGKLLSRALRNLMENAVRASTGRGDVEVTVEREGDRIRIAVSDSGPGVREEHLARIFEPYFSTHAGGTGLGLPIARRVVEEHGGTLIARNRPGGGLEAVITIPVA